MTVRRIVPDIKADDPQRSREFYVDFLGLEIVMEREEIMTFASPTNATAQISVTRHDESNLPQPDISVEVADVDEAHEQAIKQGIKIVYPLTDEPWGVRRFFAVDPNGAIINVVSHR